MAMPHKGAAALIMRCRLMLAVRLQCACFGSAVAVSGTGQGETTQSLAAPAFAGLPPIAESGIKSPLTTDRKIFIFTARRGIMAEK